MLNFDMNNFKRQEDSNSEGSDDDNKIGLSEDVVRHHSDEEQGGYQKRYQDAGAKGTTKKPSGANSRDQGSKQQKKTSEVKIVTRKKNPEPYLYEGEEKPYVSDTEDQNNVDKKAKEAKEKENDPTHIPRGAFYQHDIRGEEEDTEESKRRREDRASKKKWNHDKYEKEYVNKDTKDKKTKGSFKKGPVIQYVAKVEGNSTEAAGGDNAKDNNEGKYRGQQRDAYNGEAYENERPKGSKPFHKKNDDYGDEPRGQGYFKKPQGKKEYKDNYQEDNQQHSYGGQKDKPQKEGHFGKKKGQVVVEYVAKAPEKKKLAISSQRFVPTEDNFF